MSDNLDIQSLEIDDEIKDSLLQQTDIKIDGYSQKGFNGYVFFGYHEILNRRVAIKFYHYGGGEHKEVQLLSSTTHVNLLNVWDARTIGAGWAYFITNEITNGDLDEHLTNKSIGLMDAIKIARGILDGIGAMHCDPNNIVHRDIKPENILLENHNIAIIADFGSIKRIPDEGSAVTGSQHSLLYQPPESVISGIFSYFSDIYQVGLVLYQLLGGYFPYEVNKWLSRNELKKLKDITDVYERSKFVDEVLHNKIVKGKIVDLESLPLYVPKVLKKIIKTAINPNPALRYQRVAEFHLALHKMGDLPNWFTLEDEYQLINWKGRDLRINKRGKKYICEKKRSDLGSWRQDKSISEDTKEEALEKVLSKYIRGVTN